MIVKAIGAAERKGSDLRDYRWCVTPQQLIRFWKPAEEPARTESLVGIHTPWDSDDIASFEVSSIFQVRTDKGHNRIPNRILPIAEILS